MALNPVQPQIIVQDAAPLPPQWDRNADLDNRIYWLVVLGNVLQGLAVLTGIAFAVCIFKVSPLFVFAEVISGILWALGEEFKQSRLWPDNSVHIPHFTNNAFVPNQAIGLPKRGQNCCFNAAIQIALASEGVQGLLGHPIDNYPFKQMYDAMEGARENQQPIAQDGDSRLIRTSIAQFSNGQISANQRQQEDAGEILLYLLEQLSDQFPGAERSYRHAIVEGAGDQPVTQTRLLLHPSRYFEWLDAEGNIPQQEIRAQGTPEQKFLAGLVSPYFFDRNGNDQPVERKLSSLPDELFIQLVRAVDERNGQHVRLRKINDPLPIPLNFELQLIMCQNVEENASRRFEADAFVVHSGNSMRSGHYIAYKRTHTPETGFTWWKINDSRVEPVYTRDAEKALMNAYIVHYTRHPR